MKYPRIHRPFDHSGEIKRMKKAAREGAEALKLPVPSTFMGNGHKPAPKPPEESERLTWVDAFRSKE